MADVSSVGGASQPRFPPPLLFELALAAPPAVFRRVFHQPRPYRVEPAVLNDVGETLGPPDCMVVVPLLPHGPGQLRALADSPIGELLEFRPVTRNSQLATLPSRDKDVPPTEAGAPSFGVRERSSRLSLSGVPKSGSSRCRSPRKLRFGIVQTLERGNAASAFPLTCWFYVYWDAGRKLQFCRDSHLERLPLLRGRLRPDHCGGGEVVIVWVRVSAIVRQLVPAIVSILVVAQLRGLTATVVHLC